MTAPAPPRVSLRAIGRSALILTGSAATVQVVGIIREVFIAAQVGLSRDLDALLIALVLPVAVSGVLTSGTSTALVPAYLELRTRSQPEAGRWAGSVVVWVGLGGLCLTLLLFVFADVAVAIGGPGLDGEARNMAAHYLRLLAPVAVVLAVANMLAALCQAEERFLVLGIAGMAAPVATLAITLALWGALGLGALAIGSLLGPVLRLAILMVATALPSNRPRLGIRLGRPQLQPFARHASPLTVSAAILQMNAVADQAVASLLGPGAVSALRYADVLVRAPIGTIGPAWGAAIYPALVRSRQLAASALGSAADRSVRFVLVVFVPIAILTAAVAPLAVTVGYARGAFGAEDLRRTAEVVAGFAPLVVILMVSPVLVGAHNARKDGRLLLTGGVINVTVNVVLDIVLGLTLGAAGIALATSVSSGVVVAYFAVRLARSEGDFDLRALRSVLLLSTGASVVAGLPVALVLWSGNLPTDTLTAFMALMGAGIVGMSAYLAVATVVGLKEPLVLIRAVYERLPARPRGS